MCSSTACRSVNNPSALSPRIQSSYSSDLVTWNDLAPMAHENLFDALAYVRPLFLSVRPGANLIHNQPARIRVFINGDFAGDGDVLRTLHVSDVESVRRVQPALAYAMMGSSHAGDEFLMIRLRCRGGC